MRVSPDVIFAEHLICCRSATFNVSQQRLWLISLDYIKAHIEEFTPDRIRVFDRLRIYQAC